MMRKALGLLHRWFGLFIALFLFVSGLTGAVISWDHELDEWLNPELFAATSTHTPGSALDLANQLEREHPQLGVTFMPLEIEPEHNLVMSVAPTLNPETGKAFELDYNQIAIDPVTGEIKGERFWGEVSLSRENLLPFLYKLHYSMHIPDAWGIELGILFMGIVAIVWCLDSVIALWISFPNRSQWKKSFQFRLNQGSYKRNFDLHRSGGVWIWVFLLILALTSVSMNLSFQVMRPLVNIFSELTPSPFDTASPNPPDQPITPTLTREQILELALQKAKTESIEKPAGGIFYAPSMGIYGVGFYEAGNGHGDGGLGNAWIYFDGKDGHYLGAQIPGIGTAGDIFMQAQFPLHSGRIIGLPGRIFISIMGLVVAGLSITGLIIWVRKRRAKQFTRAFSTPELG
jgi:uncharacterized iron-regulated membrane protein